MKHTRIYLFLALLFLVIISFVFERQEKTAAFSGEETSYKISMEKDRIVMDRGTFAHKEGRRLTIKKGGTYIIKGRLDDGQIIVDAGEDEVKLKLKGLELSSKNGPAILVKNAGKLKLRLGEAHENSLSCRTGKACICASSDISIKGAGLLQVNADQGHGIFSSKDLRIKSGTIRVHAAKQALHGKKSISIEQGELDLKAGTDGIHSKGDLVVTGGKIQIDANRYGLYSFSLLRVEKEAELDITNALSRAGCQGRLEY